jgi:hypothetical protein
MDNTQKISEKRKAQRPRRELQEQPKRSREAWLEGMDNSPPPEKKTTNVSFVHAWL